jgi:superfamily I DNA/RNA helicase
MHRVKGLEFDAVVIAGYRGPERCAKVYAEEADPGAYVDVLTSERCLLHVAATRAKRYLMVRQLQRP